MLRLFCTLFVVSIVVSQAAVPANDHCTNALVIPPDSLPYLSPVIDVSQADTAGDPGTFCALASSLHSSVFFRFTPSRSGTYRFSTGIDTETTLIDTVLGLYRGSCGALQEIDCNDDDFCGRRSMLTIDLTAGQTYSIVAWRWGNDVSTGQNLQLRVSEPTNSIVAPSNDACAGAMVVPSSGPFPYLTPTVDMAAATIAGETVTPSCNRFPVARSVWYRFRPDTTGIYRFTTCGSPQTTVCDTIMALYRGESCDEPLVPVACGDTNNGICFVFYQAAITTNLSAGSNYFIVIWDADSGPPIPDESSVQLQVSQQTPRIASPRHLTNGRFQFDFNVLKGFSYTVQASSNLTSWGDLLTTNINTAGTFTFTDTDAPSYWQRFYRIRSQ
jgi:hypothetical protein